MSTISQRLSLLGCALVLSLACKPVCAELVIVVARDNPLTRLDRAELADIYLGRLSRFPDGGRAVPIDQREGAAARDEFYSDYLGQSPAQIKAHWSKLIFTGRGQPPRSLPNGPAMVEFVAGNPEAIGYVDSQHINSDVRIVSID